MLQITFNNDGTISVYANDDLTRISVTAPVNRLQAVLPGPTFDALRSRMSAFLEATPQAPKLRDVSAR